MNKIAEWHDYQFSVDLVQTAQYHLEFLKTLEQNKYVFDALDYAIYRYEYIWLPFLNDNFDDDPIDWQAPIDIEFVWQVHMLSPNAYIEDCKTLYGKVFGHKHIDPKSEAWQNIGTKTRLVWLDRFETYYDILEDIFKRNNQPKTYESRIGYDLKTACVEHSKFYYQVSLPHFEDVNFLATGLERYKKFLYLKRLQPNINIMPCNLIKLIWYTHQLDPLAYQKDTESIYGSILKNFESDADQANLLKRCISDSITKVTWNDVC
jgi:hypothetical protein